MPESPTASANPSDAIAFPKLTESDMNTLRPLAQVRDCADGEYVFHAGDADIDLYVVESGAIDILNPADDNRLIVTHTPRQFAGDIDLLTRRPVIVNAIARGTTRLLRVPRARLREILNRVPYLSEKFLVAAVERRRLLSQAGVIGLRVVGPGKCRDTMQAREFLFKNFVPFTWYESDSEQGKSLLSRWGSPRGNLPRSSCAPAGCCSTQAFRNSPKAPGFGGIVRTTRLTSRSSAPARRG